LVSTTEVVAKRALKGERERREEEREERKRERREEERERDRERDRERMEEVRILATVVLHSIYESVGTSEYLSRSVHTSPHRCVPRS